MVIDSSALAAILFGEPERRLTPPCDRDTAP